MTNNQLGALSGNSSGILSGNSPENLSGNLSGNFSGNRTYLCIDLKSFFASVECTERGLDPLRTNLVVADPALTEKTICLAVSPSLKKYGIGGRARLFEVVQSVRQANAKRLYQAPNRRFSGSSSNADELAAHPEYQIDYIVAPPRMATYMAYSTKIYQIYLKYVAPEDLHAYSVDEVFVEITQYLPLTGLSAYEFAGQMIRDVLATTGITATAGIGTNLYLAKIAMDIGAKHIPADRDGVRIAQLDEMSYRRQLWDHRPLTDFWRVGPQTAKKLEQNGMFTMGDVARCSVGTANQFHNEELLYRLFGINAELLIDHAWGWEPCTLAEIKAYRPQSSSLENGQVLHCPYTAEKTRLIVKEMTDQLLLQLVDKGLVTDQMVLTIGYDIENLTDPKRRERYHGPIVTDRYGRQIPKSAHGSINLGRFTSSSKLATEAVLKLYDEIMDTNLLVRRLSLTANHVVPEGAKSTQKKPQQLDLFTDYEALEKKEKEENAALEKEKKMQQAMLQIKKKFGKNAILKGMNLLDGATARERNEQIGGHKAK